MRSAGHALGREASAQDKSEQHRENEKDGHEGGREVKAYEEEVENDDDEKVEDEEKELEM